jgi:RND family efflux transporter MFP subunit
MKKLLFFVIMAAIVFGGIKLFKTRSAQKTAQGIPQERYYAVKTIKPTDSTLEQHRSFLAEVEPLKGVAISTKLTGIITHLHVSENSIVKKGDLLLNIDDSELQSSIKALQEQKNAQISDVKYTKTLLDRNEKLYKAGGLSREKYDASLVMYQNKTAFLESTVQKIKQINSQLTYLNIKAPFSGTISTLLLHEGDIALPGKPILKLHTDKQKMIFKYIPTSKKIKLNQDVLIDEKKVGHISKLYDYSQNGLYVAEALFDTELNIPNHSLISIEILTDKKSGCSIPLNSLLNQNGINSVMVYKNSEFTALHVNILLQDHKEAIISPCPRSEVASASEAKLALLATLGKVKVSQ